MSSKLGLIISLIFVSLFFAFGIDLLIVQSEYTKLMFAANDIAYFIAKSGYIDDDLIFDIERGYNVRFECFSNCDGTKGDILTFYVRRHIDITIISSEPLLLSVKRSTVFGYYD